MNSLASPMSSLISKMNDILHLYYQTFRRFTASKVTDDKAKP